MRWGHCPRAQTGALRLLAPLQDHAEEEFSPSTHDLPQGVGGVKIRPLLTQYNDAIIFRIRFPDMVAILNFMYHGEVNVNQEDLQNFLAAAEELRIKGLSEASSADSKLEKLEHHAVPKMKQTPGSSHGQPPAKKPRESSPGVSVLPGLLV